MTDGATRLAIAVGRIIELDAKDLAGVTLSYEEFWERVRAWEVVDEAEGVDDQFVRGILEPLLQTHELAESGAGDAREGEG
jgi:hypothetical protein